MPVFSNTLASLGAIFCWSMNMIAFRQNRAKIEDYRKGIIMNNHLPKSDLFYFLFACFCYKQNFFMFCKTTTGILPNRPNYVCVQVQRSCLVSVTGLKNMKSRRVVVFIYIAHLSVYSVL